MHSLALSSVVRRNYLLGRNIVNIEVTPVIDSENTEDKDKSPEAGSSEGTLMELGLVSKDTKGFGSLGWDGGIGYQW